MSDNDDSVSIAKLGLPAIPCMDVTFCPLPVQICSCSDAAVDLPSTHTCLDYWCAGPSCFHGDSLLTLRHPVSGAAVPLQLADAAPGDHVLVRPVLVAPLTCPAVFMDIHAERRFTAGSQLRAAFVAVPPRLSEQPARKFRSSQPAQLIDQHTAHCGMAHTGGQRARPVGVVPDHRHADIQARPTSCSIPPHHNGCRQGPNLERRCPNQHTLWPASCHTGFLRCT